MFRFRLFGFFLAGLFALQSHAASQVLISVQDMLNQPSWGREVCENMYSAIGTVREEKVSCFITPSNVFSDARIRVLRESGRFHTHLRIFRGLDNKVTVNTQQWLVDDDTDFGSARFEIKQSESEAQIQNLSLFARNWAIYRMNRFRYKADILVAAIGESKELKLNADKQIVDVYTLNPVSYKKAYDIYSHETIRQKKYLKTAIEISAVLGFGVYLYYKNLASMKVDHDYKNFWDGVGKKLTGEAIREDDNDTTANIGHVFAGEIYFLVARNNGLSFIEASLATLASSAAWEFLEYKEVFSINDEIMTGWTGAVLGEVFFQMSRAIKNKSTSYVGRALATFFNPVGAVTNGINALSGYKTHGIKLGDLDTTQWSKFDFSFLVGRQTFNNGSTESYKGVEMKGLVINIPNWEKPGTERQLFLETPVAEFDFKYTKSRFGVEDFKFVTQAVLAGLYEKNHPKDADGYEYLIGLSSGFDWDQKRSGPLAFEESVQKEKDLWARAHVIGSTVRAIGYYKGIKFNIEMKLHADYVFVNSYALELLEQAEGGREGLQSVLKKRGYYYGTGWSQQLNASAEFCGLELGWSYNGTDVKNSDFQQRFDEQVTKDYAFSDKRAESRISIKKILNKDWSITVSTVKIQRKGRIANLYRRETNEKRTEVKLEYIW